MGTRIPRQSDAFHLIDRLVQCNLIVFASAVDRFELCSNMHFGIVSPASYGFTVRCVFPDFKTARATFKAAIPSLPVTSGCSFPAKHLTTCFA